MVRGQPSAREGAAARLLQDRQRQTQRHLAAVGGRGALLRLDRRRPQEHRRRAVLHPLHASAGEELLEQGESEALRGAAGGGPRCTRRPRRLRSPERRGEGIALVRAGRAPNVQRGAGAALAGKREAWAWFSRTAPWYQRASAWWVVSAKQEATRDRRLQQLIQCSEAGTTVPPLRRPTGKA
ncbi:MAG: YdeI/OmpD-associated family protein [Dehalococcoidia bacterium]